MTLAPDPVTVTIKLFAAYQEAYGTSELRREFPPGTPVSQVLAVVLDEHPELSRWQERTRFGINLEFVPPETMLQHGDEVVLVPPVSGG